MPRTPLETLRVYPYRHLVGTTYRMPTLTSRREFFRLPYPVSAGATLFIDGANYKVSEISERGLRVATGVGQFPVGACVEGTLTLTNGLSCVVTGSVLRIEEDAFVLKLDRGPTTRDIMREQLFMAKAFPDWKPQPG